MIQYIVCVEWHCMYILSHGFKILNQEISLKLKVKVAVVSVPVSNSFFLMQMSVRHAWEPILDLTDRKRA